ncbi:helix-turn-helix domain-containing protein [Vibrio methylphosphonaticus]|uniref:helix-turn-helix domain-containing protein n=1 Tax=Vibrio methylphosphonaticus TaxID=2946866 RepID=UPI00202AACBF|nr:helix-turn-helix transcriptional regulator [Vibrio methylphosphonaticus]MCL9773887.1 helix-turn-helix transcriptional regulator [Vibrio methylphosphonaticus]
MNYTLQDTEALYSVWMSQKAKMHITQMEVAKRLSISQVELSNRLNGQHPLDAPFIDRFCKLLHINPNHHLPSLKGSVRVAANDERLFNTKLTIDGEITNVRIDGNQVVVEYRVQ